MNILFTSAGRRVELLRAFRAAYRMLDLAGEIVATDIDPLAPALQVCDQHYLVPRSDDPRYIGALLDVCRRARIDLIFPLIDNDIPILARHHDEFVALGAHPVVVPPRAVEIVGDKWRTARFFRDLGLPTPLTLLPAEFDPATATYPVFIKQRDGSASKNAFRADNAREAIFFLEYIPNPIVQEFLPGPEITTDVACDTEGGLLAVVSRRRIAVRGGEVIKGVTVHDRRIREACAAIAEALPTVGPITVQCLLRDHVPYFTEINARFGGGIPLAIAAGVDIPLLTLARVAGRAITPPPLDAYQDGLQMTRFDDSFFLAAGATGQATPTSREGTHGELAGHRL